MINKNVGVQSEREVEIELGKISSRPSFDGHEVEVRVFHRFSIPVISNMRADIWLPCEES